MNASVIYLLEKAATALGTLLTKVVFTGGSIVPIYLDRYQYEFRPTQDVDCVIEITGRVAYSRLEKKLRGDLA